MNNLDEYRPLPFELKKDEITMRALLGVKKMIEELEYITLPVIRLEELQKKIKELNNENKNLKLQIAKLRLIPAEQEIWVTPQKAAQELGISLKTIYNLCNENKIKNNQRRPLCLELNSLKRYYE